MNRNQILIGALLLILSWAVVMMSAAACQSDESDFEQEERDDTKVILVVVDRFSEGQVIYEMERLPNGECPAVTPAMEIVVHMTAGEGEMAVSTSMNDDCEIVVDEIRH